MFEVIGNRIKVTYDNFEWNQKEPQLDIFKDINQVNNVCGNGDTLPEINCWLDVFNWSVMNKTKLTEDIYQFINHRARITRAGFDGEVQQFCDFMEWLL